MELTYAAMVAKLIAEFLKTKNAWSSALSGGKILRTI